MLIRAERTWLLIVFSVFQDAEVDLYVGVAKCLSEMSDTEIDRIVGVKEVKAI